MPEGMGGYSFCKFRPLYCLIKCLLNVRLMKMIPSKLLLIRNGRKRLLRQEPLPVLGGISNMLITCSRSDARNITELTIKSWKNTKKRIRKELKTKNLNKIFVLLNNLQKNGNVPEAFAIIDINAFIHKSANVSPLLFQKTKFLRNFNTPLNKRRN